MLQRSMHGACQGLWGPIRTKARHHGGFDHRERTDPGHKMPAIFRTPTPMSHTTPACPQCGLENTYPDGSNFVCPDCAFEWPQEATASDDDAAGGGTVKDAHGNPLADGDSVILIKDLKVKGSSTVLKKGSKIKGIRLVDGHDGHNVDCKTELGPMLLKSEFLKKA